MANFIPHDTITCDDRDPPWINNRIKKLIYKWNSFYKDYPRNNDTQIWKTNAFTEEVASGFGGIKEFFCVFYKILNNVSPKYLSDIIPCTTRRYS